MLNWNSKELKYKPIHSVDTINKAKQAIAMKEQGIDVKTISETMHLSKSRIYEYLRKDFLAPNPLNK